MLRPLQAQDFDALFAAASDPLIWEQHPDPRRHEPERFRQYFTGAMASAGALAIVDKFSGEMLGSSRYYQWEPEDQSIFIGFTFLVRSRWGGTANQELKQLMLSHAFGFADTVWFHVGRDNLRSRRAMEKIGGVFSHEDKVNVTGTPIDYVFYRIDRDSFLGRDGNPPLPA